MPISPPVPFPMVDPAPRRKRSARFAEIALAAGVSASTVDRVLNERGSVSDTARRKVIEAARTLGIPRVLPSVAHGVLRFDVVLGYERDNDYYRNLDAAVQRYAQLLGSRIAVHRHHWPYEQEAEMLAFIQRPPYKRHGLLIAAADTPAIRAALVEQQRLGVPVVTVTSDISGLEGRQYTGIDNRLAGCSAAYLLGKMVNGPGRVVLMATSMSWLAHVQRMDGFVSVLRQRYPHLVPEPPIEHLDDEARCRASMRQALRADGPVVGIYNTGVASAGIVSALSGSGLPRPAWITHEATAEHQRLMQEGWLDLVLDQDPDAQVLAGLQSLMHACGEIDGPLPGPTRFRIETPENPSL